MEGVSRDASEEGIAVVKVGGDECMDGRLSSRGGEAVFDFGSVTEVKVGSFDDGVDMRNKGKGRVQDDAKVACLGGRSDGCVVNGE